MVQNVIWDYQTIDYTEFEYRHDDIQRRLDEDIEALQSWYTRPNLYSQEPEKEIPYVEEDEVAHIVKMVPHRIKRSRPDPELPAPSGEPASRRARGCR